MARYYYAGGERRILDPVDDRVAIDTRGAADKGLGDAVRALAVASKLPGGMIIADRSSLSSDLYDRLNAAGLVQPVYRSGAALVVPMPEVRVELEGDQHAAAVEAIDASHVAAEVTDDTPERLSLRPRSGSGEDALDLANFIYERAHPAASSVRMFQVVPKPGSTR
jgi:hypothetical protein